MTAVAEIKVGGLNSAGLEILEVYARQAPIYAVYRTAERVGVEYADDPRLERSQRPVMARLNPLRSSINALIDDWKEKHQDPKLANRVKKYNRRVADALILAFEEDIASAELLLYETKLDLLAERKSTARIYFLISAFLTLLVCLAVVHLLGLTNPDRSYYWGWPTDLGNIWIGADAGAFGAMFSLASGIQKRDVLPDTQWIYNSVDAILRIAIGMVAGIVLIAFLDSQMVSISIGGVDTTSWHYPFIAAFLGGFSERLVPDLLAKTLNNADPGAQGGKGGAPLTGATLTAAGNLNAPRHAMQPAPDPIAPADAPSEDQEAEEATDTDVQPVADDAGTAETEASGTTPDPSDDPPTVAAEKTPERAGV